jgi:putative transcriptional regulator
MPSNKTTLEISTLLPGTLLIAHPLLKSNFFSESVILIVELHKKTYKGLVVNKQTPYLVKEIIEECKEAYSGYSCLFGGGPVNTSSLIMLHTNEWYSSNTMSVNRELSISSDTLMVDKLSMDNLPMNYKIIAGMCQWPDARLKKELSTVGQSYPKWLFLNNYESDLLFDNDIDTIWSTAIDYYSQNLFDQYF